MLVLAGLPKRSLYSRDKKFAMEFENRYPEFDSRVAWSERRMDLSEAWAEVQQFLAVIDAIAEDVPHGGFHVLAFHSDVSSRDSFKRALRLPHRIRFLDSEGAKCWGQPAFLQLIDEAIALENKWRSEIRPTRDNHPLLLPPEHFKTTEKFGLLWNRSANPQSPEDIEDIALSLKSFTKKHLSDDHFQDLKGNRFKFKGPFHGQPVGRDDWRFTFRMRDGFHYDVQPPFGKHSVELSGTNFDGYVNAYPNGHLRRHPS